MRASQTPPKSLQEGSMKDTWAITREKNKHSPSSSHGSPNHTTSVAVTFLHAINKKVLKKKKKKKKRI